MLFTRRQVIEAAARETSSQGFLRKALSSAVLRETAQKASAADRFDIFLSHARLDEDEVYGTKLELERFGFSVYVDWMVDPTLDRSNVTAETATVLRDRMRQCRSLLYVHTENSSTSRWMPWELGYFDGYNGRAAILPIMDEAHLEFSGAEYLGIYPYVDSHRDSAGAQRLWVNHPGSRTVYAPLNEWLSDLNAMRKRAAW